MLERLCHLARAAPCQAARVPGPTCCARPHPGSMGEALVEHSIGGNPARGRPHGTGAGARGTRCGPAQDRVLCLDGILALALTDGPSAGPQQLVVV